MKFNALCTCAFVWDLLHPLTSMWAIAMRKKVLVGEMCLKLYKMQVRDHGECKLLERAMGGEHA